MLTPSFYQLFTKTYLLFIGSQQVPQKPKLILFHILRSTLHVLYCKVLAKRSAPINFLQVSFYDFCSKYQVFFFFFFLFFLFIFLFFVNPSVPLYFLLQYFQQKIDHLILLRFWLLSMVHQQKSFSKKLDKQLKTDI